MGQPLMAWWARTRKIPGGDFVFSKIIGFMVPYTGSIHPVVLELEPGHAKAMMKDRRKVRNHLQSIHAIAQMNLGEFVTGLAMTSQLLPESRAIITHLAIDFVKKARGPIVGECHCENLDQSVSKTHEIVSEIRDASGEVVSRAVAHWLVGPRKKD